MESLKQAASYAIQANSAALNALGDEIWKNPELNHEEYKAHDLLTSFLARNKFSVEKSYTGLETAFRAEFGSGKPKICVICEYDALPDIGHGCGHNLIAECGVAVALGLKAALEFNSTNRSGTVVVLGTPGEEGGGGKVLLTRNGAFSDLDVLMMAHPSPVSVVRPLFDAVKELKVTYRGVEALACACPWEGLNALDAAVTGYNSVSVLRQQLKPSWRVQMVILEGGVNPNIVPQTAVISVYVKAPDVFELSVLEARVTNCFRAASEATGCAVTISQQNFTHESIRHNSVLAEKFAKNYKTLGVHFVDQLSIYGSTDMIKVSKLVPTLYPHYKIGNGAINHSKEFTKISNLPESHAQALLVGEALVHTALDVLGNKDLLGQIWESFRTQSRTDRTDALQ